MDRASLQPLYPKPGPARPLRGLYLSENLRETPGLPVPFVYGNFVTSLDGRIAVRKGGRSIVPDSIANDRDWRLFQELAVQADLIVASGRYLRARAEGGAQEILRTYDDPSLSDLEGWRRDRGLPRYPDVAVVSRSLDFPVPESLRGDERSLLVITGRGADPARVRTLEDAGARIHVTPSEDVDGHDIVDALADAGHRFVYNATGPEVHRVLLAAGRPDRLYLTFAPRILAGGDFSSLAQGTLLDPAARFRLRSLYLDPEALDGDGQLFASFERTPER